MLTKRQRAAVQLIWVRCAVLFLNGEAAEFISIRVQAEWDSCGLGPLTRRDVVALADAGYLVPTGNTNTTRHYQFSNRASPGPEAIWQKSKTLKS